MDFAKDVDKPGFLIHGTYIDNWPQIVRAKGLFPLSMLNEDTQPSVGFSRRPEILHPGMISVCELYTHPYGHRYSLREQRFWGIPAFHFIIVSNYPYKNCSRSCSELWAEGIDHHSYDKPWHYEGNEIALVNQGLSLDTFVALVLPTDEIIQEISELKKYRHIFTYGEDNHRMTSKEIVDKIQDALKKDEIELPLFDLEGNLLD